MKPLHDRATNYGAVGATGHFDFDRFPPKGFDVVSRRSRIGHGRARFDAAVAAMRTWKVQRLSGIEVDVVAAADSSVYRPVGFEGREPQRSASYEPQQVFDADGEPFLQPGDSAMQRIRIAGKQFHAPVRVIAVDDEPTTHAVIFGALQGHPEAGEERFLVEMTDDDSVYFHLRVLSRPATWYARLGAPYARALQRRYHDRFMDALRRVGA